MQAIRIQPTNTRAQHTRRGEALVVQARKTKAKPARKVQKSKPKGPSPFNFEKVFGSGDSYYYGNAASGTSARGAQKAVGYKGSGQKGSAPDVDAQGNRQKYGGVVYRYAGKYGGNVDEYSPIWTPETRSSTGDTYTPGTLGITAWALGFGGLLAVGAYAIISTSALSG
eukprot:CAMPEP_0198246374 /NCGR_PEP_ID=MMETSP1446-20131203/45939_1 /TAXON_ID=1461542 ORGANISM="Unidentified sp, Strain CCMP2111" /NCGR_SAMPLE_ID=MMETSP1446 /ASSEMBLY_ACC=CAM_ASM_001112 /LENGTH=168 /DNA_ID=CAMNT_0043930695 /DNA_START=549 /DNA_END=1055 /DNA_ORIENTATION=-